MTTINDDTLAARAPFADMVCTPAARGAVLVADRDGLAVASVLLGNNQGAALAARVRERFGIELPSGPRRNASGDTAFAGTGPLTWLATCERGGDAFAAALKETIGDLAAVADQSSGYAILRLSGHRVRETLAKLLPIDVHARAFAPGDVAATSAAHVGVTLWRLEDSSDGAPVIEIAMFRSLAASFWHSLAASSAEFGLVVTASPAASMRAAAL
jgi:heterotetrameric sarcosine oxidase gamma subunit